MRKPVISFALVYSPNEPIDMEKAIITLPVDISVEKTKDSTLKDNAVKEKETKEVSTKEVSTKDVIQIKDTKEIPKETNLTNITTSKVAHTESKASNQAKSSRHFVESPTSELRVDGKDQKREIIDSPVSSRRKIKNFPIPDDSDGSDSEGEDPKFLRWPDFSDILQKREPESPEDYLRILLRMMGVSDDKLTMSALVHILVLFHTTEKRILECYKKGRKLHSKQVQDLLKEREHLISNLLKSTLNFPTPAVEALKKLSTKK